MFVPREKSAGRTALGNEVSRFLENPQYRSERSCDWKAIKSAKSESHDKASKSCRLPHGSASPPTRRFLSGLFRFYPLVGRGVGRLSGPPATRTFSLEKATKIPEIIRFPGPFGAASQIRTGDLILTKDALYLLSYSSIFQTASLL